MLQIKQEERLEFDYIAPAYTNAIQFVTIATTGNSVDFGDNTVAGEEVVVFPIVMVVCHKYVRSIIICQINHR